MFVYADNAATTRLSETALAAMLPCLQEQYGNPSSLHAAGQAAGGVLVRARETMARLLGCRPRELVFTSGGSESDNQALLSAAALGAAQGRRHIVSTAFEHHAVLHTLNRLRARGFDVTLLPVHEDGVVTAADIAAALRPDTCLVSVMYANNEIGTIQPVDEIGALCRARGVLFHTDAVQGFLKVPFTPAGLGVDLLSLSGHKIHAPKGIGALYIRQGLPLKPFILGGGQENGLRSGTEPTGQIAAFAVACQTGKAKMAQSLVHMNELKTYTLERLHAEVPKVEEIISGDAPHILALTLPGYKSEVLVRVMGDKGVCISAGSACHRGKASHVYEVMGLTKAQRDGAFRVSFSDWSTKEEVDCFVQALKETQEMLFPTMS